MPTFSATAGRAASTLKINETSNRFAANLDDRLKGMSLDEREALMDRLNATVADTDVAKQFAAGTYAQSNSGQPAKAIGTGSPSGAPANGLEAVNYLLNSGSLTPGVKAALRRILVDTDPDYIEVGVDGTPTAVGKLSQELMTARADLAQENDASHSGSLAHQLAAAKAKPAALAKVAKEAKDKVSAITGGIRPGIVNGKSEALAAIKAIEDLAK